MDTKKALEAVARQRGKTVDEIRAEINEAITEAWANGNGAAAFHQKLVPCAGEQPTPEELLDYLSKRLAAEDPDAYHHTKS